MTNLIIVYFITYLTIACIILDFLFITTKTKNIFKTTSNIHEPIKKVKKTNKLYSMDKKAYIKYLIIAFLVVFVFSYVFFRSIKSALFFSLIGFYYPKYYIEKKIQKNNENLSLHLKEGLLFISNSLKAGASLQVALHKCSVELKELYGQDSYLVTELEAVLYDIKVGKTMNQSLEDFRDRVNNEDISTFVNAAIITDRMGGNLTYVMQNLTRVIDDKRNIKMEIKTLTASKRLEANMLTFMPVGLVIILSLVSPTYMSPMYESEIGRIMMIVGAVLLVINFIIGKKIVNINI